MRSLMLKLILAFLLTSVAGVALASVFIRQFVTRQFDNYVVEQHRSNFIDDVSTYYATYNTWEGLRSWLFEQGANRVYSQQDDAPPPPLYLDFILVDAAGVTVLTSNAERLEERMSAQELAQGAPITIDGRVIGTVITAENTVFRDVAEERYLASTDGALLAAAAVGIGIALLLGTFLARLITRPLREITAASRAIASGDLQQHVPVRSQDELGLLADQFNQMSADLSRAVKLRRQIIADIAHDLRTPLTVIAGYLESLRDQVLKPTPARFATMHAETQVLLRLVDDLHMLSLADAGELPLVHQSIAPRQLLERVAETYRHTAEQHEVALHVRTEGTLPEICVDPERMLRALGNLVSNALRYTPQDGQVTLIARCDTVYVQFIVADTGPGIAPEHLPNIFERFYRADESRQQETGGSGLGLAIVKSIVETHGGQAMVESALGQGAVFTIALPIR